MSFEDKLIGYKNSFESFLKDYLESLSGIDEILLRSMEYSLFSGGKRIRPVLMLAVYDACGGESFEVYKFASAIEMIHTYSLIHDDLPCMDDDDMRRGNPSCHKMFGEATALLAGDALLTHAFDVACDANLAPEQINSALSLLSQNAGVGGMIGGQVLDLMYEKFSPSLAELLTVHKLKTGALISAACLLGCIAGNATDAQIAAASKFAYNLGISFQIRDDLLDIYGDEAKLGKHVGSDEENNKTTYVTIVGKDRAQQDVKSLTESAKAQLAHFQNTEFLEALADYLVSRES